MTGIPDEQRGERLVALYTRSGYDAADLWQRLSETDLPKLWLPKRENIYQVDALPTLGTGKLDLRRRESQGPAVGRRLRGGVLIAARFIRSTYHGTVPASRCVAHAFRALVVRPSGKMNEIQQRLDVLAGDQTHVTLSQRLYALEQAVKELRATRPAELPVAPPPSTFVEPEPAPEPVIPEPVVCGAELHRRCPRRFSCLRFPQSTPTGDPRYRSGSANP